MIKKYGREQFRDTPTAYTAVVAAVAAPAAAAALSLSSSLLLLSWRTASKQNHGQRILGATRHVATSMVNDSFFKQHVAPALQMTALQYMPFQKPSEIKVSQGPLG